MSTSTLSPPPTPRVCPLCFTIIPFNFRGAPHTVTEVTLWWKSNKDFVITGGGGTHMRRRDIEKYAGDTLDDVDIEILYYHKGEMAWLHSLQLTVAKGMWYINGVPSFPVDKYTQ